MSVQYTPKSERDPSFQLPIFFLQPSLKHLQFELIEPVNFYKIRPSGAKFKCCQEELGNELRDLVLYVDKETCKPTLFLSPWEALLLFDVVLRETVLQGRLSTVRFSYSTLFFYFFVFTISTVASFFHP